MSKYIEKLTDKYLTVDSDGNPAVYLYDFQQALQEAMQAQREACANKYLRQLSKQSGKYYNGKVEEMHDAIINAEVADE